MTIYTKLIKRFLLLALFTSFFVPFQNATSQVAIDPPKHIHTSTHRKPVICGFLDNGKWMAGRIRPKDGQFVVLRRRIKNVNRRLRQLPAHAPTLRRQRLERRLGNLRRLNRRSMRTTCRHLATPLPAPEQESNIKLFKDASTIVYDHSIDVLNTLGAASNQAFTASAAEVSGKHGGKATVTGDIANQHRQGIIDFNQFLNRMGFPKFSDGTIAYDLDITDSAITGTLSADALSVLLNGNANDVAIEALYNLYHEAGLWRGNVRGEITIGEETEEFDIDYDAPILVAVEAIPLNTNGVESPAKNVQAGSKVRLRLWANSNAPVNWVNISWDSPAGNLQGGGSGESYCGLNTCPQPVPSRWFAEGDRGYWLWYRDFDISSFQAPGEYVWTVSVKNAAELTSSVLEAKIEVLNENYSDGDPEIVDILLSTSGTQSGTGATTTLVLLVSSPSPPNWLNRSFNGPLGNLHGGGSGQSFNNCSPYLNDGSHICFGHSQEHWFTEFGDTLSQWSPNGAYYYSNISVKNEADKTSTDFGGVLSFNVTNNLVATTPIITSIEPVYFFAGDWQPLNNNCLEAGSMPDPLQVGLIITANSNAPVSWIDKMFEGPSGNLSGGGSGVTFTEIAAGSWRYLQTENIAAPEFAPKGEYYWHNMAVRNEGEKSSAIYGGSLSFELKTNCP